MQSARTAFRPPPGIPTSLRLFSDAEAGKNPPEEVIAGELSGDLVQGFPGGAKLFGDQLAGPAVLELALSFVNVVAGAGQGIEVPLARGDRPGVQCLIAH